MQRKIYSTLNVCRLSCALLVVMIHCKEYRPYRFARDLVVCCFSHQAVPFFFIVSGFFLGKKLLRTPSAGAVCRAAAGKNLRLYIAWTLLWIPGLLYLFAGLYPGQSVLRRVLLMLRYIVFAGQGAYWYLLVLAESFLLLWLFLQAGRKRLLAWLSILGFLLGLGYEAELPALHDINAVFTFIFTWSNNVVMKGLPYVTLGCFFSAHEEDLPDRKGPLLMLYAVACVLNLTVFCASVGRMDAPGRYVLFYPAQAVLLFLIAIKCKLPLSEAVSTRCRELSSVIYLMHTVFIFLFFERSWALYLSPFIKFGGAVLLSAAGYYAAKRLNMRWLCFLLGLPYRAQS